MNAGEVPHLVPIPIERRPLWDDPMFVPILDNLGPHCNLEQCFLGVST